jgi:hypothetical protein
MSRILWLILAVVLTSLAFSGWLLVCLLERELEAAARECREMEGKKTNSRPDSHSEIFDQI